ncbi:hypothetical protein [Deinococcus navajonensis]|uniref:Pentapeptide repeat-containing protein n=1 Tax=Deinococcus navajonensis TaxID=309884 RepID=A0ABV8XS71_9DEIO
MTTKAGHMLQLLGVALSLSVPFVLVARPAERVSHVSVNGLSTNGLAFNGLAVNGLAMNGLSTNGLSTNGLSTNGLSTNGLSTNGLSARGSTTGSSGRPGGALDLVSLGQRPLKKK